MGSPNFLAIFVLGPVYLAMFVVLVESRWEFRS